MKNPNLPSILQALLAAVLFGASAPLAKLLLGGIDPIPLAGFLYIGSGIGSWLLFALQKAGRNSRAREASLTGKDFPWLLGAVAAGGVAAPILLMLGLKQTPASTSSLLLNFESVATTLLAVLLFKEAVDKRILWAIGLITAASILLSWSGGQWGFSLGALGILAACFLWGLDNNLTRHISGKNPLLIVGIKGLGAGGFSLVLTLVLGKPLPGWGLILSALLVGAVCYGLSIQLFILAMRSLGASRTGALFGAAPFIGTLLSFLVLRDAPGISFWAALPIMLAGAWLMLIEDHAHVHEHAFLEHTHAHVHDDQHHGHEHADGQRVRGQKHSHKHIHAEVKHSHSHTPDIHHRHGHGVDERGE